MGVHGHGSPRPHARAQPSSSRPKPNGLIVWRSGETPVFRPCVCSPFQPDTDHRVPIFATLSSSLRWAPRDHPDHPPISPHPYRCHPERSVAQPKDPPPRRYRATLSGLSTCLISCRRNRPAQRRSDMESGRRKFNVPPFALATMISQSSRIPAAGRCQ
jgi:hypothetical protein